MYDRDNNGNSELAVVLSGEAGQGIKTIENLMIHILKRDGYCVFSSKEYMSRIRGGCNSTTIRIAGEPIAAFVERTDLLIPLTPKAISHVRNRIGPETVIAGASNAIEQAKSEDIIEEDKMVTVSFEEIAKDAGNRLFANSVAAGVVLGVLGVDKTLISNSLDEIFEEKGTKVQQGNTAAAMQGYMQGRKLVDEGKLEPQIEKTSNHAEDMLLNGSQAVGLGSIAGGCDFIASYPMSPSTGVLAFLAKHASNFDIVVEQAEDEIAAINMGLGAWYAGGRALTTTSGGGFALMCEGMSLAGMLESPMVIHLAQRPGPATGLPTRTEQGDLEMTVYAGHGEFARIVLAPSSTDDAFHLSRKAFELADELQIPVVILTDQFLMDSYRNITPPDIAAQAPNKHILKTESDYQRYALTEDGLSPRGIPGHGVGVVCLDSDEHDQNGHITENLELRNRMVEKRLKRYDLIAERAIPPTLFGESDAPNLLIAWGSTLEVVKEALGSFKRNDISLLHFQQVFPLPPQTAKLASKAQKKVVIENNATGQFAKLLQVHAKLEIDARINKFNGMPFSVEEVEQSIRNTFQTRSKHE